MCTSHNREADRRASSSGFTLLEVVVAAGLVGLVALAVAPLMLMAAQTSAVAQEATDLTAAGSEQIEVLRALPFTDPQLSAGGSITSSEAGYALDPYGGDANLYNPLADQRRERVQKAYRTGSGYSHLDLGPAARDYPRNLPCRPARGSVTCEPTPSRPHLRSPWRRSARTSSSSLECP